MALWSGSLANTCIVACLNDERVLSTDDILNNIFVVVVESKPKAESRCCSLVGAEKDSSDWDGGWRCGRFSNLY